MEKLLCILISDTRSIMNYRTDKNIFIRFKLRDLYMIKKYGYFHVTFKKINQYCLCDKSTNPLQKEIMLFSDAEP